MLKCILIYLWIYIGLFYMIEAGEDDEHVHIKLHMTSGQRKRTHHQKHHHHHHHTPHHKKRHSPLPPSEQSHALAPPPVAAFHDLPQNYLAGISATSASSSPIQHFHESGGQMLNMNEDVYGSQVGGVGVSGTGEPTMIPSYLAKKFALFPPPTATYETKIMPHNSEGFNVVGQQQQQPHYEHEDEFEEDNEITAPTGRGAGSLETIMLGQQQMENYQRHKPLSSLQSSSSSAKTVKNEQLLQQLFQQQHNVKPEIMNAAAYKSAKLRGNKYRAEKDYNSEDDVTEAMMFSSPAVASRPNPALSYKRPALQDVTYSGGIKSLTVDDIWSQLQQQYLSKYTPQAQALTSADSQEQPTAATKMKRKRNTKRQKPAKPTTSTTYSTSWPPKSSSYGSNNQHKYSAQLRHQQQHFFDTQDEDDDDRHTSSPYTTAFSSNTGLSAYRNKDLYAKRPFNKFTTHHEENDDNTAEADEDSITTLFGDERENDDEVDVYGDNSDNNHDVTSVEEAVYQRGKKFTGQKAYGHKHHRNNPFNYHDHYGSFSTPVVATVATNVQQPSTYHPNSVSSTLPSYTATLASASSTSSSSFLPTTISHPSASATYQWQSKENYPASYQTYHLHHQQQPQWAAVEGKDDARDEEEEYATYQHRQQQQQQQQSSALLLPKASITQTSNLIAAVSPTQSNDFTVSSSSSSPSSTSLTSSVKSTAATPGRYKKRKNRIKTKRNRIVVI